MTAAELFNDIRVWQGLGTLLLIWRALVLLIPGLAAWAGRSLQAHSVAVAYWYRAVFKSAVDYRKTYRIVVVQLERDAPGGQIAATEEG